MKKKAALILYIASLCCYIASIIFFINGSSSLGVMWICIGSCNLCIGTLNFKKYKDELKNDKDK